MLDFVQLSLSFYINRPLFNPYRTSLSHNRRHFSSKETGLHTSA